MCGSYPGASPVVGGMGPGEDAIRVGGTSPATEAATPDTDKASETAALQRILVEVRGQGTGEDGHHCLFCAVSHEWRCTLVRYVLF